MTVYTVTDGEYSEYHVVAVFSTREKAEAYMAACGGQLEELETDQFDDKECIWVHWYSMDSDGLNHGSFDGSAEHKEWVPIGWSGDAVFEGDETTWRCFARSPISVKHARSLCRDKRHKKFKAFARSARDAST